MIKKNKEEKQFLSSPTAQDITTGLQSIFMFYLEVVLGSQGWLEGDQITCVFKTNSHMWTWPKIPLVPIVSVMDKFTKYFWFFSFLFKAYNRIIPLTLSSSGSMWPCDLFWPMSGNWKSCMHPQAGGLKCETFQTLFSPLLWRLATSKMVATFYPGWRYITRAHNCFMIYMWH